MLAERCDKAFQALRMKGAPAQNWTGAVRTKSTQPIPGNWRPGIIESTKTGSVNAPATIRRRRKACSSRSLDSSCRALISSAGASVETTVAS
ncbi:hypothetical protein D3C86_1691530 [compost metagenome]